MTQSMDPADALPYEADLMGQREFVSRGFIDDTLSERAYPPFKERLYNTLVGTGVSGEWCFLELREGASVAPSLFLNLRWGRDGRLECSVSQNSPENLGGDAGRDLWETQERSHGEKQICHLSADCRILLRPKPLLIEVWKGEQRLRFVCDDINVGGFHQTAVVRRSPEAVRVTLEVEHGETFYGTGEDFGTFEKTGMKRNLLNADALGNHGQACYQNSPFLFSSHGKSFEILSNEPASFDVQCERQGLLTVSQALVSEQRESLLSLRVGFDKTVNDSVRTLRTGLEKPRGVPAWSYGLWLSRCYYQDEAEVRQVLAEAKAREWPVAAINLDARCWMDPNTRTDFVPDASRFENFEALIRDINSEEIAVSLWENPYVSSRSDLFHVGRKNGFFALGENSETYPYQWVPPGLPGFPQPPVCGLVDFTNPAAVVWWKELHLPLLKIGVRCFKTDFGEEIPADARFFDGRRGLELRNEYADLYNQAVMAVVREFHSSAEGEEDGVIWARSAYRQTQAFPVKWAGDGQTNWRSLRATLRAGLSQAFGGALFWSHDVGGFYGDSPDPELYLRWAQFALWCSHIRLHGTTAREPWVFGERVDRAFRACLKVRELLRPYFEATGHDCVRKKQSFLLPMLFADQGGEVSRWAYNDDQFFAGEDVVVAPFLSDHGGRLVSLPQGRWVDLRTGEEHQGPCTLSSERTVTLPVFFRAESNWASLFRQAQSVVSAAETELA